MLRALKRILLVLLLLSLSVPGFDSSFYSAPTALSPYLNKLNNPTAFLKYKLGDDWSRLEELAAHYDLFKSENIAWDDFLKKLSGYRNEEDQRLVVKALHFLHTAALRGDAVESFFANRRELLLHFMKGDYRSAFDFYQACADECARYALQKNVHPPRHTLAVVAAQADNFVGDFHYKDTWPVMPRELDLLLAWLSGPNQNRAQAAGFMLSALCFNPVHGQKRPAYEYIIKTSAQPPCSGAEMIK